MKHRLRKIVLWLTMGKGVEDWCKTFHGCQLVTRAYLLEPMVRRDFPSKVWEYASADLLGALPSDHKIFVLVDFYNRFYESICSVCSARNTANR